VIGLFSLIDWTSTVIYRQLRRRKQDPNASTKKLLNEQVG